MNFGKYFNERPCAVLAGEVAERAYTADAPTTLKSISLSASGRGRFELWRNSELVATLFSTTGNLNPSYPFDINLETGDKFLIKLANIDNMAQDMYASYLRAYR